MKIVHENLTLLSIYMEKYITNKFLMISLIFPSNLNKVFVPILFERV